ncbi:twin-arginine translocation signal domain-containing protein [bacterium]|nr:twin-arginine translocation signal domain-containing protein [bacterium]
MMAKRKTSATDPVTPDVGTGLSRRDFLAAAVSTATAAVVGVIAAGVPRSVDDQFDNVLRVFDRPGSLDKASEIIHGNVSIRPVSSLSLGSVSPNDQLLISMTLKGSNGEPIPGVRLTGYFGDAVTDKNGQAKLTGLMRDLVSVSNLDGSDTEYLPEDRNWNMYFNTRNQSNSIRIDSGFVAKALSNDEHRPTTICTSGRSRQGNSFMPVVACLIVS